MSEVYLTIKGESIILDLQPARQRPRRVKSGTLGAGSSHKLLKIPRREVQPPQQGRQEILAIKVPRTGSPDHLIPTPPTPGSASG